MSDLEDWKEPQLMPAESSVAKSTCTGSVASRTSGEGELIRTNVKTETPTSHSESLFLTSRKVCGASFPSRRADLWLGVQADGCQGLHKDIKLIECILNTDSPDH
jgi:hypothetical protein